SSNLAALMAALAPATYTRLVEGLRLRIECSKSLITALMALACALNSWDPWVTVKIGVFCLSLQLHSLSRENITLNNLAGNEVSTRRGSQSFAVALGRGLL